MYVPNLKKSPQSTLHEDGMPCHDVTVTLTSDLRTPNYKPNWTFVPNLNEFPHDVLEISCS